MNKFVNIDVLKEEIKKECKECVYKGTTECLSCYVPSTMALVDVVYERQEHDKRFKKYKENAVEVVRCKDCQYKVVTKEGEYNPEDIVCDYWQSDGLTENDFCSYGEREDNE